MPAGVVRQAVEASRRRMLATLADRGIEEQLLAQLREAAREENGARWTVLLARALRAVIS